MVVNRENNLGIVICKNFIEEIKFIIGTCNIGNVSISPFAFEENGQNDCLIEAIKQYERKCNKIIIIENNCNINSEKFTSNKEKYKIYKFDHYFDLFINRDVISHFTNEKLYLVTPGLLKNWKENINVLSLAKKNNKIRLLDTGIYKDSFEKLQELAEYLNLPYDSFFVGLDFFRMFIEKILLEWKLECGKRKKEKIYSTCKFQLSEI
jgi:two-component system phosphate regulon sensor histidine kinase PhoR